MRERRRRMKKRSQNRDTLRRIDLRWLVSLFCVSPSNFSFCSSSVLQIKEEGQGNSNFSTVWLFLSVQNLMPFDFLSLYCLVIGLQVSVEGNSSRVEKIRHFFSFPKKSWQKSSGKNEDDKTDPWITRFWSLSPVFADLVVSLSSKLLYLCRQLKWGASCSFTCQWHSALSLLNLGKEISFKKRKQFLTFAEKYSPWKIERWSFTEKREREEYTK